MAENIKQKAFTLIELLVVISIIAMLMAILMPALAKARRQSRSVLCSSNLRQLSLAAQIYADNNGDYYPLAYIIKVDGGAMTMWEWDFLTTIENGEEKKVPGLLWRDNNLMQIQQCPSYRGGAWGNDPYTGYNYNRSYIGGSAGVLNGVIVPHTVVKSARKQSVKRPCTTAIFGDGAENTGKPNKYMLSPFAGNLETFWPRSTGAQGYRHLDKTNVAYCDGSVRNIDTPYTETDSWGRNDLEVYNRQNIHNKAGFISYSNQAYDLK